MSGGSMDYLYSKVEDASFREDTAIRKAFRAHLRLVADALRAVEWVDSCDSSPGDEEEAIRKVIDPQRSYVPELRATLHDAIEARDRLAEIIELAKGVKP